MRLRGKGAYHMIFLPLELNHELNKYCSAAYIFSPATGNLSDTWREERIFKSAISLTQKSLFPDSFIFIQL